MRRSPLKGSAAEIEDASWHREEGRQVPVAVQTAEALISLPGDRHHITHRPAARDSSNGPSSVVAFHSLFIVVGHSCRVRWGCARRAFGCIH